MNDDETYLPEFNVFQRVGTSTNKFITAFVNYRSTEFATRVNEAIAQRLGQVPQFHIEYPDIAAYLNDINQIPYLQYKSAVGLFIGWLHLKRGQPAVSKIIRSKQLWPPEVDPITLVEAFRYVRLWQSLYQSGLPPWTLKPPRAAGFDDKTGRDVSEVVTGATAGATTGATAGDTCSVVGAPNQDPQC